MRLQYISKFQPCGDIKYSTCGIEYKIHSTANILQLTYGKKTISADQILIYNNSIFWTTYVGDRLFGHNASFHNGNCIANCHFYLNQDRRVLIFANREDYILR